MFRVKGLRFWGLGFLCLELRVYGFGFWVFVFRVFGFRGKVPEEGEAPIYLRHRA